MFIDKDQILRREENARMRSEVTESEIDPHNDASAHYKRLGSG